MMNVILVLPLLLTTVAANGRGHNFEADNCAYKMAAYYKGFSDELGRSNCVEALRILEDDILNSCRPAEPVKILAHLREMIVDLNSTCPLTAAASPYMRCTEPVLFTSDDTLSGFTCGPDNSTYEEMATCLENEYELGCGICGFLRYIVSASTEALCGKTACISANGISQTIAGTNCTEFTREELFTGKVFSHQTYPGYIFSLDVCGWDFSNGTCYN